MRHDQAVELIRAGVDPGPGTWAELGAGSGTFTRALAELLGPEARIVAVDRKPAAVRALRSLRAPGGAAVEARRADFTGELKLDRLDGVLMANALHFVEDQEEALGRIVSCLGPGGRLLLVEYDRRRENPWVPHPVPPDRFRELAAAAGLTEPREVGRRSSAYHREMYAAVAGKIDGGS